LVLQAGKISGEKLGQGFRGVDWSKTYYAVG
jgi:hypothetical protein